MESEYVELSLLRNFSPLDGLKKENLGALARKTQLREMAPGRLLFREGESDKKTFYLVSGAVELRSGDNLVATIHANTPESRNPLAPGAPRRFSARTVGTVEYICIDSDLLDVLLTWDQTGIYEVGELQSGAEGGSPGDDWMTTLLQTKAFHRVPPANLQAIFLRMQRLTYRAGDVVIKQGDEGDFFYAITAGRCVVTRETPLNREGIRLAELGPGDTFGEEALISESRRNATVSMQTDGALMRLGKQDFQTLLNEPMLHWLAPEEARAMVAEGAKWLDVRLPSEFESHHLPEAVNIPLYFMRLKLKQLDRNTRYVVVCDTGRRSSAGAYILSERGFEAFVVRGGLGALKA